MMPVYLTLKKNCVPLTVTLCSPVPGWVKRSTWIDTSPTLPSSSWRDSIIKNTKNTLLTLKNKTYN